MDNKVRDYWPTEVWRQCEPEEVGMDSDLLFKADREIKTLIKRVNSFLVVKDGYLIFENYYNGYGEDEVHSVKSVTKSVVSALIGIALDKGYLKGLNENIYKFFPEYCNVDLDYLKEAVTIEKLLSMTSAIFWGPRRMTEGFGHNVYEQDNWVKALLELPINEKLIGEFQYNSGNSHLLSSLVSKVSNMTTKDFANQYLFQPLGISKIKETTIPLVGFKDTVEGSDSVWSEDPQGNNTGGSGLYLKPRDMAKIGYLYINKGYWDGKHIISKEWIETSTKKHSSGNDLGNYGFQWWIRNISNYHVYFALGYGGQYIINVPKLDLIVVFTATPDKKLRSNQDPFNLLAKYIIPAVRER